jgi:hypothetical protein
LTDLPPQDPIDGRNGTTTVTKDYHYTTNNPLNATDPLGLESDNDEDHNGEEACPAPADKSRA